MQCKWCERAEKEKHLNTDADYILPREYTDFGYGLYWTHRVQLWGIGSEVRKQCENQMAPEQSG